MRHLLKVWRQAGPVKPGRLVDYTAENISPDMSFLEMLDVVNEGLIARRQGADRVRLGLPRRDLRHVRLHDQRRRRTGRSRGTTVCQLHMRHFKDSDTLDARAVARKGVPPRQGPGGRSQRLRSHHPGRRLHLDERRRRPGRQRDPDAEADRRKGDGGGRSASAAALASRPARTRRPRSSRRRRSASSRCCRRDRSNARPRARMVERHDAEGFGSCSNEGECEAVCPKEISMNNIARMNREYLRAVLSRLGSRIHDQGEPASRRCRAVVLEPAHAFDDHVVERRYRPGGKCAGSSSRCRWLRPA